MKLTAPTFAALLLCPLASALAQNDSAERATGVVYEDRNDNGQRDDAEPGLPDVRVSNGRDVTTTDAEGRYALSIDAPGQVFVIKPRGYRVPTDAANLPQFYYVHQPGGSPDELRYEGIAPTGELPESIDFPLIKQDEPDQFKVLVFGDPQPRNMDEVNYMTRDVLDGIVETDAAFGITLGDVVFDDLSLLPELNNAVATLGIPWINVLGNHDINFDVPGNADGEVNATWRRIYGPATYSFDYGPAHFVVLDNVMYEGQPDGGYKGEYHGEFTDAQLRFIENDLAHVPDDRLVVFAMHIPLNHTSNRDEFFDLFSDRPNTLSLSAHLHRHRHNFFGADRGWDGDQPHHHLTHGTVGGSWFTGVPDEYGVPHTMMRDGTPNGHSVLTIDGSDYRFRYIPARRPADEQMHIHAPASIAQGDAQGERIVVNVYDGSERSTVEMRVGGGEWAELEKVNEVDPYYAQLKDADWRQGNEHWRDLPSTRNSSHLWASPMPTGLEPGGHRIEVRTTDMYGQTHHGARILRVTDEQ